MPGIISEPEDRETTFAIERMLDDGAPSRVAPVRRSPVSRKTPNLDEELPAEARAAQRRAHRRVFRLYCVACGRSSEVSTAPLRTGRCVHCDGTMLVELAVD